ncbi:hypothetical protein [Caulobacter sp. FWC2]|uniref:hypothetical protein n=1 Tax=Caulobacter sp. FWC2 TaxID=69664 RepID=UPI000C156F32|nr:hypothetical protein [Caulobacter sp. FWC2]PIB92117.1 hypothetical protein CSW62_11360 [Caulobacter sp. FWC2]
MIKRSPFLALCAAAYVGAVGFSVADLLLDPPLKSYVIAPGDDWTRCVEVRATSERLAQRQAQKYPSPARTEGDCATLPAVKAVDQRLLLARGFNTLLIVSAILAALWSVDFGVRAWRRAEPLDDPT